MLKIDTSALLQKEMDRKDFVKNVGIGILALSGVTAALKAVSLAPTAGKKVLGGSNNSYGYGSSAYGGAKKA
jgi:hypothetical protein